MCVCVNEAHTAITYKVVLLLGLFINYVHYRLVANVLDLEGVKLNVSSFGVHSLFKESFATNVGRHK